MSANSRQAILLNLAAGKGFMTPVNILGIVGSATANTSGYFALGLAFNNIGTTLPSSLVSLPTINAPSEELYYTTFDFFSNAGNLTARCYLARIYRIGGVVLTATGNQWTHDTASFPLTRTQMGASSAVNLLPMLFLTTATATTAPALILKNVAGTTGYVNQVGSTVVGTKTLTFATATATAGSGYMLRLENGDCAVQDITGVDVTTAAATGAADIYGAEIINIIDNRVAGNVLSHHNAVYGGMFMADTRPAIPAAGTLTSYLAVVALGGVNNANGQPGMMTGVLNV